MSHRIPEITDQLYKIDDAMRAGFGWELGPFETWDAIGAKTALDAMNAAGVQVAAWVNEMIAAGNTSFYKMEGGKRLFYDIPSKSYKPVPRAEGTIVLSELPESSIVWKNSQARVYDIGDGILAVSWTSKMNTIGAEVIQGLNKAIDLAEAGYKGLVVYNDGALFTAGANVGMIFMMAVEQEYDDLDMAIRTFQNTMMRMRHSSIPVVAAPHQLCLGGGTELCLHADKVVAHAETYMGLVEFGVGVIPGGGGSKEFALRLSDELKEGDIRINALRERFLTIGQAKVSTSGEEAFALGYLRRGTDEVDREPRAPAGLRQGMRARPLGEGLHQAAHAQGHQGARPRRPGHRVHRRQHHAERQLHQRARHADLAEAGPRALRRRPQRTHGSQRAIPAGPGAEDLPGTLHAAQNAGALAVDHHQRESVAELMNAVKHSGCLGVSLAKPRVALSATSPRFAAGFPLQSLTQTSTSA